MKFILVVVSFFCFSEPTLAQVPTKSEQVTICGILALTGDFSAYGESVRNGMILSHANLSAEASQRIRLSFEDDAGKPSNTATAFKKLAATGDCTLFVSMSAQPSMAIAPLAEQAGIPLVAIAIPPKIIEGRKNVFLFFSTVEQLARGLLDEAGRRKYQKVARISTIHEGRQSVKSFVDKLNNGRITFVADEDFSPVERDFRAYLSKLRSIDKVDGIYANLVLGQLGIFVKQVREQGITLPIFTTEFYNDSNEQKVAGAALDGQWFVDQVMPDESFLKSYKSKFGMAPSLGAPSAYDLVQLIAKGNSNGTLNRLTAIDFLKHVRDFHGCLGTYSATGDNRFSVPVATKLLAVNRTTGAYMIEQSFPPPITAK